MHKLRDSSDSIANHAVLRQRLIEDGYLYLRNFLNRQTLDGVRSEILQCLSQIGWIDDSSTLTLQSTPRQFTSESFANGYAALQSIESFHRLGHSQQILSLISQLLSDEVFCHPSKVCRIAYPRDDKGAYTTKPHQDFVVLHVCADVLTTWIPLCSCDDQRPGLQLIPGSHRSGAYPPDPSLKGARPLYLDVRPDHPGWATAHYEIGDLLIFHSLTIHAARANRSRALRLSVDFRYQSAYEPMRPDFVHPHGYPETPDWPELTGGWLSQQWTQIPASVPIVPLPDTIDFDTYVAHLTAPASRLLQGTRQEPGTSSVS